MKKARPTNPPAVSRERTLYLRRKRRRTHLVHACQIGFLVFFFAQWEISARLGWIDSFILSQPSRILETLRNMSQNHLMMHVGVTLYETLTGFVLGVLLGVAIAVVLWWSGFVSRVAEPYLVVLNSLPKIALGPVIIIVVGAGTEAIIFMASVPPTRKALKWRAPSAPQSARYSPRSYFRPISTHCLIH